MSLKWDAKILLKSDKIVNIDGLKTINRKSKANSTIIRDTDFENYILPTGQQLSFVGEDSVLSVRSDNIEYLQLDKIN